MGFEAFRFRERFKGGLPPGIVPPRAAQCTRSVLSRQGHRRKAGKFFVLLFVLYKK